MTDLKTEFIKIFAQPDLPDHGFSHKVIQRLDKKRLFRVWSKQVLSLAAVEASLIWAGLEVGLFQTGYSSLAAGFLLFLILFLWFETAGDLFEI